MKDRGVGIKIIFNIFVIFISVVLIISIIRVAFNSDPITLRGFIQYASNTPSIDISYYKYLTIGGDWGVVDGLRIFLNVIMDVINVLVWICKNVANLMIFITYYVVFLFV